MKYVSTRGQAPVLAFADVLLAGLARDGGLYLPEAWPDLPVADLAAWRDRPYADIAVDVMAPFTAGEVERDELADLVDAAYRDFDHPDVAPLRPLGEGTDKSRAGDWVMELFHGPTLAFKDIPLQLVGLLMDRELSRRGERVTVVGATSGDTGSAAIEALRRSDAVDVFILHPKGRVSELQRRQMTTVDAPNVHNIAVEGTFDDCQDLVKALFADEGFRDRHALSAVNSINWARLMAQIVYYVVAAARLADRGSSISVVVPSGNFGNMFSGWAARRMGAPISRLVVASNRNDTLTRFFATGRLEMTEVVPTISPSMDIQVSSNLERLLFELFDRDGVAVADLQAEFRDAGGIEVDVARMAQVAEVFTAGRLDEGETRATMARIDEAEGMVVDPHTAVGLGVAAALGGDPLVPRVTLATAHPAKFPDAVEAAIGRRPETPERLARVIDLPEHYDTLPADLAAVRDHIAGTLD